MPSTYSDLKLQLMATGENTSTWGNVTNLNLTALEEAVTGTADVPFASANVTLTLSNTNNSQTARNLRLNLTGTTGGARNLIVPSVEKLYLVNNTCADPITVKNTTGAGIAVPAGKSMWVFNNGTDVVDATTHLTSLTLGSPLPIASGGTGSNTAAGARTALGATTVGGSFFTLTNPSAVTFPQINANNTVTALDAAAFRTAIGAGSSNASGTVTSVNINGSTTGLIFSGGPVTTAGTFTVSGTLIAANGGTGLTSPGTSGNVLTSNGSAWVSQAPAAGGGVTSITGTANQVIASASTGAVTLSLPQSVNTTSSVQFASFGVGTAASGTSGEIRATNNVTAFFSSDIRLKENVADIQGALDAVAAIGGKTFSWTDEYIKARGGTDDYFVRKQDFGVIAQDVAAAFPLAVRTREDGMLAVDYEKLCALAFQAIIELRAEVEALKRGA